MKVSVWMVVLISILVAIAVWAYMQYAHIPIDTVNVSKRSNYDIVTLKLPNSHNPDVFGPKYWESFHKLAEMVPCSSCQGKAVAFMRFFHDVVNQNTDKPLFDEKNYKYWIDYLTKNKNK